MKKTVILLLALTLCAALAFPAPGVLAAAGTGAAAGSTTTGGAAAAAANAAASQAMGSFGPVTVMDGTALITFNEARSERHTILIATETWAEGATSATYSSSQRMDITLIVVKPGSVITRSAGVGPWQLSPLTLNSGTYVLRADRVNTYTTTINAGQLFGYPYVATDLMLITASDGTPYFLMPGDRTLAEAPAVALNYTVKQGDTLDSIALNYYGVNNLGKYLQDANPEHFAATGGVLEAGRILVLPVKLNGVTRLSAPLATGSELIYIVKSGDTLMTISQKFYGRSDFGNYIYQRNKDRLKNPNLIQVGQILVLPVIEL